MRNASGDIVAIASGATFANFEMREDYAPGQKLYFGITRKSPAEIVTSR
jgi:hypothetical protein